MNIIEQIKTEIERRIKILREDEIVRQNCSTDFLEGKIFGYEEVLSFLSTLESKKPVPADLEEAAEEIVVKMHPCMEDCIILGDRLTRGELTALVKAGAELVISELFEKLKITPLKVIGKDEYGYPVYDFEVGHYYRTFTLFGEKYKCDQTDSGKAGEEMIAGQGEIVLGNITKVGDRLDVETLEYLPEESEFKNGDKVSVQIRKKD